MKTRIMNTELELPSKPSSEWQLEKLITKSQDYSGYRRESAVMELCNFAHIDSFRALLVRINDWVPQVRAVAKTSFMSLLKPENIKLIIGVLPEIYHLTSCRRVKASSIIKAVEDFLKSEENINGLQEGVLHERVLVALRCTRILIKYKLLEVDNIIERTQKSKHNIIRLKGAELFKRLKPIELPYFLAIAIQDRFMPIRRRAAQILLGEKSKNNILVAERLLLDQHQDIRILAIEYMNNTEFSLNEFYFEELASENTGKLRCALWAIGELKLYEKMEAARLQLNNEHPSVRRQALATLYQLEYSKLKDVLLEKIVDDSLMVRKTATSILCNVVYMFDVEDFINLTKFNVDERMFVSIIRACRKLSKWDRIELLLYLAEKEEMRQKFYLKHLIQELNKWVIDFNRSGIQPTQIKLALIRDRFMETRLFLFKNGLENISSLLIHVFKLYHIEIEGF